MNDLKLKKLSTKRPVSLGAEKWLGKPTKCLDHGFVYLVDYMGNDLSIEQAARVSYGGGTRKVSETTGLIRYLRRHAHTTPFEMVELKFHAKMPIFVARQWIRHRTVSVNEISGRYSKLDKEFYVPEKTVLAEQSTNNKQGRGKTIPEKYADEVRKILLEDGNTNYDHYENLVNTDVEGNPKDKDKPMLARELARMELSLNYYTQWYWKINLHNFMHFSELRLDPHAQYEIRIYAEAMSKIVKSAFPIAWQAFEDYDLNSQKLTSLETKILEKIIRGKNRLSAEDLIKKAVKVGMENKREQNEMLEKFKTFGAISSS